MVGLGRFELPTSPLSGVRSSQLSYRPRSLTPDPLSVEPASPLLLLIDGHRGGRLSKDFEDTVERAHQLRRC